MPVNACTYMFVHYIFTAFLQNQNLYAFTMKTYCYFFPMVKLRNYFKFGNTYMDHVKY